MPRTVPEVVCTSAGLLDRSGTDVCGVSPLPRAPGGQQDRDDERDQSGQGDVRAY